MRKRGYLAKLLLILVTLVITATLTLSLPSCDSLQNSLEGEWNQDGYLRFSFGRDESFYSYEQKVGGIYRIKDDRTLAILLIADSASAESTLKYTWAGSKENALRNESTWFIDGDVMVLESIELKRHTESAI